MRVRAGQRIDRYELLEPLGAGGQGAVWKAADLLENRLLRAVKLVPRERATPEAFERARREAHALAQVGHPALIACHGIFEDIAAGMAGIVLDLVDGEPLADVTRDPRMTPAHRHALLEQIAEALAFVHERNIVHRDLKPDNILVTERFWANPTTPGTVKLVDFGISVELGNPRPLTATGAVLGTVPYLAPELLAPELAARMQGRAENRDFGRDMFAFGVLAAELLLGRHPTGLPLDSSLEAFAGTYRRIARGQLAWPPPDLSGPWGMAAAACLSFDISRRPRSGSELLRLARGQVAMAPHTDLAMATQTREGPTAPMTAPTPAPPRMTVPSNPRIEAFQMPTPAVPLPPPPPSSIPTTSTAPLVAGLAVVILASVGAVFAFSHFKGDEPTKDPTNATIPLPSAPAKVSADPPPPVFPVVTSPSPKPTATLTADLPEPSPPAPLLSCPATCCGGKECVTSAENTAKPMLCAPGKEHCYECASKRTCVPWECSEHIDADGKWLLRLAIALGPIEEGEINVKTGHPSAEVCLRPSARPETPWKCTSVSASPKETSRTRMPATTSDLHTDGIDIEIREDDRTLGARYGARFEDHVRVTALCQGLVFRDIVSKRSAFGQKQTYRVTLHLDDPM